MLQRILFFVVLLLVVWRLLAAWGRRMGQQGHGADSYSRYSPKQRRRRREWSQHQTRQGPEELVECSECGTLVPSGKALLTGTERVFCGPNCRDRVEVQDSNAH